MSVQKSERSAAKELGERIDTERRRKGMTQSKLAEEARCDVRTLRRVIHGERVRLETLNSICRAAGIRQDERVDRRMEVASDEHGAYTLNHCQDYLGDFFAYRRSFTFPESLIRSRYRIAWSENGGCLTFSENQEFHSPQLEETINYSQSGEIFISNTIGLLHFLTKHNGALRLITLKRLKPEDVTLGGIVLTQAQAPYFRPSVSPIYFRKIDSSTVPGASSEGAKVVRSGDPEYVEANASLIDVERQVASFAFAAEQA